MAHPVAPWLAQARALRPGHALSALTRTPDLLLLNPRDLRKAGPGALTRVTASSPAQLTAVLRAASHMGALVGLAKPGALQGEGAAPLPFALSVFRAAQDVGLQGAFFLTTQPLPVGADDASGGRLKAEVQRYLDAGFTEIVVQAPASEAAADGVRVALEQAKEREVSLALAAADAAAAQAGARWLYERGLSLDELLVGPGPNAALDGRLAALAARPVDDGGARLEALTYSEALVAFQAPAVRGGWSRALAAFAGNR
jgi:hypothetical protein